MIKKGRDAAKDAAMKIADSMVTAALTAPKGCGASTVEAAIVTGDDKDALTSHMRNIAKETGADFFNRDAANIDSCFCVVLLWTRDEPLLLADCGLCGFTDCAANRNSGASCAFNVTDLGIAVGSAVSVAADNRIDNRVMFSAGKAATRMGIFDESVRVCYGIPLNVSSKNIFFDRETKSPCSPPSRNAD